MLPYLEPMMNHSLTTSLEKINSECFIIGVFSDDCAADYPIACNIKNLIEQFKSRPLEPGDTFYPIIQDQAHQVVMVHCGTRSTFSPSVLSDYVRKIASLLTHQRLNTATVCFPQLDKYSPDWQIEQMILSFDAKVYQFLDFKTQKNQAYALKSLEWYLPGASSQAIENAQIIAKSIRFTKNLANLPANVCTPTYLAKQALLLDSNWGSITTTIMDKDAITTLKMGAFLAVAQGSSEAPQFIQIHYQGAPSESVAPIVLIGKGITFDSGGISLKPPEFMEEMKFDMAGAASVLGAIQACAELKLPINVIGLMPCTENMPSGSAIKPGDVITTMAGLTVEITNTDAEGRLVLADALHYAKQFNPKFVLDIATLTGAMVIALGYLTTGFMSNDQELSDKITAAGARSQEKVWRMPLDSSYQEMLSSPIADMVNAAPSRVAGSITAACFLARFAESFRWAHFDIAGTGWVSGKDRCATGRPVALLVQFLRDLIEHAD